MDDCISRKAAIDAIDVLCQEHRYKIPGKRETYSQYNEAWQDALDRAEGAIGNLPSAQPENDWIPVTKKAHPDLPIRVQVQMDNGWIITAYYQEGEWLSVPDCDEPLEDEWIEAWRELPEPYKGEQE